MKKVLVILIMLLFIPLGIINAVEKKAFCDTGQKYYYDCKSVATQCTYKKSNGDVAYINISVKGEALAAEGNNSGQGIKNWADDYDGVPTINKKYSDNKECPSYLIEDWGFYVVDTNESLNAAMDKLDNPNDVYTLSTTTSNTQAKNVAKNNDNNVSTAPDVDSCAGFKTSNECINGSTANNGNFGCTWNKKYEFCSPTGLTYLTCGSGKTDAHDIPELLPRLVSYFILILKTATPIVLIIMGMVQIIKAIANSNEDEIKKAKSSLIKKLIAAVLVFFSISIVQFVIDQVVDDDESGSVAACMDCFINNNCGGVTYYTDGYGKCYNVKTKSEVKCNTDIGTKKTN